MCIRDRNNKITKKFFYKKLKKDYNSYAYTTIIEHNKIPKNNIATQTFTKKGPIAFLPISNKETSIVYSIKGKKKPEGWSGKSFACYQLSKYASSDWMLFIDADTELEKGGIDKIIGYAQNNNYSMVSAWPKIEMKGISEKILMPLLNFLVFSSFPAIYSLKSRISSLGLAHGACILFQKKTYEFLGGHKLVKDSLFEDTELAKKWRSGGEMSVCINGINIIKVRMYDSFKNIWLGFEKNSYPAFKNSFYWTRSAA